MAAQNMNHKKRVDINRASVDDLEKLTGVGRAKAEAIVEARQCRGGFDNLVALQDVPGIGPAILEQNHDLISCGKFQVKPNSRKSHSRGRKQKRHSMDRDDVKPSTSHSDTPSAGHTRSSRSHTPAAKPKPKPTETPRRKLTRNRGDSDVVGRDSDVVGRDSDVVGRDSDVVDRDSDRDTDSDHVSPECMSPGDDSEAEELAGSAGEHSNVSARSSVTSHTDGHSVTDSASVMECTGGDSPTSPDLTDMSDTPHSPASLLDKPWMKRKSDGEATVDHTVFGKKPRPLRVKSSVSDSDYPEYDSAASLRSCLAAACNSGTIRKQRIPSKNNPPPQLAEWLNIYQEWSHAERLLALDELIESCEPTQVRHLMAVIEPQFQRDFISLLPKELALYVLSFLDPRDLLQAAQTCRYWRILAEDNLLWREKCREEAIDEATVFENRARRRAESVAKCPWKNLYLRQKEIEHNWRAATIRTPKALKGHDDHVITCLEFSGTKIVSGSDDNTLKVWSAITGKCLRTLIGHTGGVWSSQMCGNVIISGSTDRTLKVWNADTGQCTHTLYGHTSTVRCMHLYKDRVVSGSRDATLRLWNVDTGQCLHVLMGHMAAVRCVQYDGKRVVSGAYDYTVRVWDAETESCIHILNGHTNRVYSLQFDGVHIVSGSLDTSIRVWDVESGNCLHTLIGHQSLTSGMELKDNLLVSGNADSTVKVWDITTGQCLQTLQGPNKHQSAVTCLQFNKKFVITSSDDGSVKIWDLKAGDFLRNLVALDSGGSGGVVWRIRCSNTKLVCAVGSRNGTEETKLLVLDFDVDESDGRTTGDTSDLILAT